MTAAMAVWTSLLVAGTICVPLTADACPTSTETALVVRISPDTNAKALNSIFDLIGLYSLPVSIVSSSQAVTTAALEAGAKRVERSDYKSCNVTQRRRARNRTQPTEVVEAELALTKAAVVEVDVKNGREKAAALELETLIARFRLQLCTGATVPTPTCILSDCSSAATRFIFTLKGSCKPGVEALDRPSPEHVRPTPERPITKVRKRKTLLPQRSLEQ